MKGSLFHVGDYNHNLYLKISGEIKVNNVYPLRSFLKSMELSNCRHIVFDFRDAHYLDSTSLGTIAAAGLKYLESCKRKLSFVHVSKELEKNFANLGFGPIADMVKGVEIDIAEENLIPLPEKKEKVSVQEILEAHKSLGNLSKKNKEIFKNVIDQLEKKLKKLG